MRKEALFIALLASFGIWNWAYADEGLPTCVACQGVAQETPNQHRLRLGQPIVASYPASDLGEKIETPNHRRQRLGLPIAKAQPATAVIGISEETPNHKRQRLAAEATAQAHATPAGVPVVSN